MAKPSPVAAERERSVSSLARALVAAARTWSLYPPEHPAVRTAVERLAETISSVCRRSAIGFGVTPDALLVDGAELDASGPSAEAAAWLHARDVLHIAFDPDIPAPALHQLLRLFAEDPQSIREQGGPAPLWLTQGHPGIRIEQIDLQQVLEDPHQDRSPSRKDDLWRSIVQAVLDRRRGLDSAMQQRLLEIAGDVHAIGELAGDVMAPNRAADGSPMLTSQAAAVVAAYRHLLGIIDVMAPDRRAEVLHNLAAATAHLDARVVMQLFSPSEDPQKREQEANPPAEVRRAVADALDDSQVAQLLATTLALDGRASDRLASVFSTMAPDESRQKRVLTMTRETLSATAFGKETDFHALWAAMEELLLAYSEKPFVAADYRDTLDTVQDRAARMAADVPEELASLVSTLEQDNVRRLSVTLLLDLLNLERDPAQAPELARDLGAACEDLLLAGDYESAGRVAAALASRAAEAGAAAAEGSRVALDSLASTAAFCEAVGDLDLMEEANAALFLDLCRAIGPASVEGLRHLLDADTDSLGRTRATDAIKAFGARAIGRLAPLISGPHWYAQRNAAELLGAIGAAEGVPLLQPLLRSGDARVMRAAVRALSSIDDPSAGRCVHTVLRATSGEVRQAVVQALVEERDRRVVPLLGRILDESDALGTDHGLVVQTLGAVATVGGDGAIPSVERVMRKRRWFAGGKAFGVAEASVRTLRQIGTPAAAAALERAAAGDRLLRRAAHAAGAAS